MDPAAMGDDLPVDPVCGMGVDPARASSAGRVSEYRGKTYYFCADMCKRRFDADPAKFLSAPGQGGMGAGMEGDGRHGEDPHGGHGK
jgi:YHS domain-containing protein